MASKIIYHNERSFKPVKVEMEFTTRQQLATFIQIMYNPDAVANSIKGKCPLTKQAELMSEDSLRDTIDDLIDISVLDDLIELADA